MKIHLLACCTAILLAHPAGAAPPLVTDDAGTLEPGACQLESERRHFRLRTETDLAPACHVPGLGELGFAHGTSAEAAAPDTRMRTLQLKRTLWAGEDGRMLGAVIGEARRRNEGTRQRFATLLLTQPVGPVAWLGNLGLVHDNTPQTARHRNYAWGLAAEVEASTRVTLLAEGFGVQGGRPTLQIGARAGAIPGTLQWTISMGQPRSGGRDGRWIGIGIRLETPGRAASSAVPPAASGD